MVLMTVNETDPSVSLCCNNDKKLPCAGKEYSEEEVVAFQAAADAYILINHSFSMRPCGITSGYRIVRKDASQYVIRGGELIGFIVEESHFLPLDFSYFYCRNYGGENAKASGSEKYFLIKADETDTNVPRFFSVNSEAGEMVGELFKKLYQ